MTTNKILMLLKMRGPLTALEIAHELKITKEGVRQQLLKLVEEDLIHPQEESKGVGRPQKTFSLTSNGNAKFPDTHAELTLKLINIINAMGENALQTVIDVYEETGKKKYHEEIDTISNLEQKLQKLVEIRTREGYMAEYSKNDEGYLLVENHCPICAAATIYQGFCSSELNTFRSVLGKDIIINRVSHIIGGDRRCAYQITSN
ncbi:metalloregulator ArsR/SmtB family transcription factor [Flavobacterium sp. 140616W15]|uniref:helix-turn-helix transcriptional regulator n=1 Tax=Flavobacterium sp. 140616W15 TaxID=2478552 RepID=UPI000F0C7C3C|nr:metalloregulator ArsR/SmtB family transcription factor [Flavobacterium sp. 140616W15]AYN04120.1 transcriptional regulator [Flavobacterium sp. 140616W15]